MSGIRERYRALRPGLAVGVHTNNQDFWDILYGRPSAVFFLVLFGGIRWITPNLLTIVSLLLKFGTCALVFWGDGTDWIIAAIVLQLSCTFDCADGQLARYRKTSSLVGSYLDKVVDGIGFLLLFAALAEVCYRQTGEVYYVHFATLVVFAIATSGYVKWLAVTEALRRGIDEDTIASRTAVEVKWWHIPLKIVEFNEGDLHLWIGLSLILHKPEWAMWLLAVTQTLMVLGAMIRRGYQIHKM